MKALRKLDINAFGVDVSNYAIKNCDIKIKKYCKLMTEKNYLPFKKKFFDIVITKDVLEHLTLSQIKIFLKKYHSLSRKMFHVIPLGDNGIFRIDEYHLDKSHLQMQDEKWWKNVFKSCGCKKGNAFITLKKI